MNVAQMQKHFILLKGCVGAEIAIKILLSLVDSLDVKFHFPRLREVFVAVSVRTEMTNKKELSERINEWLNINQSQLTLQVLEHLFVFVVF